MAPRERASRPGGCPHAPRHLEHLDRLLGGELLAVAPRLPWAQLLRRTHGFDVVRCSGCGGQLRLLTAITDKAVARAILVLRPSSTTSSTARGKDPTWMTTPRRSDGSSSRQVRRVASVNPRHPAASCGKAELRLRHSVRPAVSLHGVRSGIQEIHAPRSFQAVGRGLKRASPRSRQLPGRAHKRT
jgi:hypothetical protein